MYRPYRIVFVDHAVELIAESREDDTSGPNRWGILPAAARLPGDPPLRKGHVDIGLDELILTSKDHEC